MAYMAGSLQLGKKKRAIQASGSGCSQAQAARVDSRVSLSRVSLPTTVLVYTVAFDSIISDGISEQVLCGKEKGVWVLKH